MNQQNEPDRDEPDKRQTVADPEKVAQANRIRALLERRDRCIDALEETAVSKASNERDESEAKLVFIAHLRSLIVDLYPLMLSNIEESDDGDYYKDVLEEKPFGSFDVQPPESMPTSSVDERVVPGETPAEAKTFEVKGLEWFLEKECPLTVSWNVQVRGKTNDHEANKDVIPSLPVCLNAAKAVMNAMQKLGIDAETKSDDGDFGFDYKTIDVHEEIDE